MTEATAEPRRKRERMESGARRRQILAAAARLLAAREGLTTARLAANLEISEGALYRHFSGKARIFAALLDYADDSINRAADEIAAGDDLAANLARGARAFLFFGRQNPGLARLLTGAATDDAQTAARARRSIENIDAAFRKIARASLPAGEIAGLDAAQIASLMTAFVLGKWQWLLSTGNAPPVDSQLAALLAAIDADESARR